MNLITVLIILINSSTFIACANEPLQDRPSFRILAPQVICTEKRNSTTENRSQITISMQTKNGQKLNYRVEIYFEVLGGYRGQQHSLKLWNSVRKLERKINTKEKEKISTKNQINVNSTELTLGVYYIFKIVGLNDDGVESDPQNFTVSYSDGSIKRTNEDGSIIPDDLSFLLIGSALTYADLDYRVVAQVQFCEPRQDYYIKWNISDINLEHEKFLNIPGSILEIPANVFRGGQSYKLVGALVQSNDSKVLIYASLNIRVLKRGNIFSMVPENIMLGISREITLNAIYRDRDNLGVMPSITWNCMTNGADNSTCDMFEMSSNYSQIIEFLAKGDYNITATIEDGGNSSVAVSTITVNPDVIALPEIRNLPTRAIPAGSLFELDTPIHNLIPNCYAHWIVVKEDGFEYFDGSTVPNGLGNITILDMEEIFLSELVDYANNTLTKDILLTVPPANIDNNWPGLKANSRYKFRLYITCPAPIANIENAKNRKNVTSFVDITISTNKPPVPQRLEVTPLSGNGMSTVFKFSTGVASDDEFDYPLKYTFYYVVNNITITIGEFFESMVSTAVLPYSELPIETGFVVCDARLACSTEQGPNITTTATNMTSVDFNRLIMSINASFGRLEYENAIRTALVMAINFQNMHDPTSYQNLKAFMKPMLQYEITRLSQNQSNAYYVSSMAIVKFVKLAKSTIGIFIEDDATIQKLLALLQTVSITDDHSVNLNTEKSIRIKRSVENKNVPGVIKRDANMDVMHLTLEMSEALLNSTNETVVRTEKQRVPDYIHRFMQKMCKKPQFVSKTFDTKIAVFEVRKINGNQLLKSDIQIPTDTFNKHASISLNDMMYVGGKSSYCVGKIRYPSDYMSGELYTSEIYELVVLQIDGDNSNTVNINISDVTRSRNFDVKIPIPESAIEKGSSDKITCQTWTENDWSSSVCTKISHQNNYVHCKCDWIGIFRASVDHSVEVIVQTTPLPTSIPSTTQLTTTTTTMTSSITTPQKMSTLPPVISTEHIIFTTEPNTPVHTTEMRAQILNSTLSTDNMYSTFNPNGSDITGEKENYVQKQRNVTKKTAAYTGVVIFLLLVLFIVTGFVVHRRKKTQNTLDQQFDTIASEMRQVVPGIHYGRFHDEDTMRGDNETVFSIH